MKLDSLIAILRALRSGTYIPTHSENLVVTEIPFHRCTCIGGVIYDAYRQNSSPPYSPHRFADWCGMTDAEMDAFATWTGSFFERTRDFDACADAIQQFFDPHRFFFPSATSPQTHPSTTKRNLSLDDVMKQLDENATVEVEDASVLPGGEALPKGTLRIFMRKAPQKSTDKEKS